MLNNILYIIHMGASSGGSRDLDVSMTLAYQEIVFYTGLSRDRILCILAHQEIVFYTGTSGDRVLFCHIRKYYSILAHQEITFYTGSSGDRILYILAHQEIVLYTGL